ncbi:MAG: C25 family cysteine peptidase [Candidatus Thermoplasmatota archaeon]
MKKKYFLSVIVICGLFLTSSYSTIIALPKQDDHQQMNVICSEPQITDRNSYCSLTLPEATTYLKNPGKPILPVIIKTFVFPIGTIFSEIHCTPRTILEKNLDKKIIYAQKPVIRNTYTQGSTEEDQTIYQDEQYYPETWFSYSLGVGLEKTQHVTYLTIQLYPIRYAPKTNSIQYATNFDINIYDIPPEQPALFKEIYDLIIIAPQRFERKLQRLVDHKITMGISARVVTTEEIYTTFEGRDHAEQIKYFIRYALEGYIPK